MDTETKTETKVFKKNKKIKDYLKQTYEYMKRPLSTKTKMKIANFAALYILPFCGIVFAAVYFYVGFKTFFDKTS